MRPIDKGAGIGWTPAPTLSWNKSYAGKVTAAWKALSTLMNDTSEPTLTLNTDDCLQLILNLNTGTLVGDDAEEYGNTAIAKIREKTNDIYKTADTYLATAVGYFCAYCETYLPGKVEVDHRAAEAHYPTYITTWSNFVPSCGPCNNYKRAKPTRAELAQDPPPPQLDPDANDDGPFVDKLIDSYGWPDIYDWTFQYFRPDFQYSPDGGQTWNSLSYYNAANVIKNRLTSKNINTRKVRANVTTDGNHTYLDVPVAVIIRPWGYNLVDMCGLNEPGNPDSTYDRRLFNRTVAWFDALTAMQGLANCVTTQDVLNIWPALQVASKTVGFWSMWVALLSQWSDLADNPHSLGYWLFMSDNATDFYPGTVTGNIKLPPMG